MRDNLFSSGPWTGFYNYQPKDHHRMDLNLEFKSGSVRGEGNDDVGRFVIRGQYDTKNCECQWTKTYVGGHSVFYRGFREGKGIWGVWKISDLSHGGFHIWPRGAGESDEAAAAATVKPPVERLKLPPSKRTRTSRARRSKSSGSS